MTQPVIRTWDHNKGRTELRNPELRKARAQRIIELIMTNMNQEDIGRLLGLNRRTIYNEQQWAIKHGILEEVKKNFSEKLLQKAAKIYEDTMDLDADTVEPKTAQIRKLKLEAARDVAQAAGVVGKQPTVTAKVTSTDTLDGYLANRATRLTMNAQDAITAPPQLVDAETVQSTDHVDQAEQDTL